jgi:hypothetical protein
MINELLTTCIYLLIYNDICILNDYRLDTYRTGEYIPLSQGGISSLISLFTIESSPDKADVFTFMFRAPLKVLSSQFITCSFVEQLRSSDGNEPLRAFPARFLHEAKGGRFIS